MGREIQRIAKRTIAWFHQNARDLPWRRTRDPYAIWISEVMLQQTQVKTVISYWNRWMATFPNVETLASAEDEKVLKCWEGLGYYTRARNLQKAARIICEQFGGRFPMRFEEVLELPGIGRYTAGAVCSIAYGTAEPILDGNVARVLSRVFLVTGSVKERDTQDRLWKLSSKLVAAAAKEGSCSELNQGLMELGALVCNPRDPVCVECPIQSCCGAFRAKRVEEFPRSKAKEKPRKRRFVAIIFRHGAKVLIRKRPSTVVNGGLWEFPNVEISGGGALEGTPLGPWSSGAEPFAAIKHTITNNRITLQAVIKEVNGEAAEMAAELSGEWRSLGTLVDLPFSSAHGKLRKLLTNSPKEFRQGRDA